MYMYQTCLYHEHQASLPSRRAFEAGVGSPPEPAVISSRSILHKLLGHVIVALPVSARGGGGGLWLHVVITINACVK